MEQNLNDKTACLVTAFQSGDVSAFSTLYDMHINLLFNYGCKLTTDKELLKDCIHDVFVKLYTKKAELGIIDNFKSYLLISLKNKLCDELRRRMFMSETAVEELNPVAAGDDGLFYPAQAVVENGKIKVWSDKVKEPETVRYGWQPFTRANLVNGAGLPASTFRAE